MTFQTWLQKVLLIHYSRRSNGNPGKKRPGNFPDYLTDLVFFCNSFLKRFLSTMVGVAGGGDVQILNLHIFQPVSHKFSIGEDAINSK